jgi:hypothetical protein
MLSNVCEILFPFGKNCSWNCHDVKEAFKDEAMGITQVYDRFNHFKRGKMFVECFVFVVSFDCASVVVHLFNVV